MGFEFIGDGFDAMLRIETEDGRLEMSRADGDGGVKEVLGEGVDAQCR